MLSAFWEFKIEVFIIRPVAYVFVHPYGVAHAKFCALL